MFNNNKEFKHVLNFKNVHHPINFKRIMQILKNEMLFRLETKLLAFHTIELSYIGQIFL